MSAEGYLFASFGLVVLAGIATWRRRNALQRAGEPAEVTSPSLEIVDRWLPITMAAVAVLSAAGAVVFVVVGVTKLVS